MHRDRALAWRDGAIVAEDEGTAPGPGCYTTGRWTGREIRWSTAVVARLVRDARALGYGEVSHVDVAIGMHTLGALHFDGGEGIVRMEARRREDRGPTVIGTARPVGRRVAPARVGVSPVVHPGPARTPGAKIPRPEIDAARDDRDARGLDEVLLLDAGQRLVEGSRCNVLLHTADGRWATPPLARGGVAGVALGLLTARLPDLARVDLSLDDVRCAREIVLTNGARGAFPARLMEGEPSAGFAPGPLLEAARRALAD